jgi:mannose-6-phosphate isomerase-like protein (cupin superfamily)
MGEQFWIYGMVTKSRQFDLALIFLALLSSLFGCTPAQIPYVFLQYGQEFRQVDVAKVLADNPLKPGENFKLITLGQGQGSSHHVVQIRDRESPHLHKAHDGTVIMVRGRGYLVMDKLRITLTAGDIVHIPRAVPHYYVNTDLEPTVAFVIFAPPYDGKDNVPATMP